MHLYCVGCKSHQECSNPQHSVSANGRAMVKATCPRGHICCSFKGMASGAQGEGFVEDAMHKLGKVYNTKTEKWQKLPLGMTMDQTLFNGRLGRHEIHMTPSQVAEWEYKYKGMAGEGLMDFLKPLVNKAKDAAIAAAKKKAEELAKAAAEKLVNTIADKAKEKMLAKKGNGLRGAGRLHDNCAICNEPLEQENSVIICPNLHRLHNKIMDLDVGTSCAKGWWYSTVVPEAYRHRCPDCQEPMTWRPRTRLPRTGGRGLAPAPAQMSASQLASIKKKMRSL